MRTHRLAMHPFCYVYLPVLFSIVIVQFNVVEGRQPVIFDTDVGDFIDDSFAILAALERSDLDVRLIVTASGDTRARASVVAKYLIAANRTDIPVGIGVMTHSSKVGNGSLFWWGSDISLDNYVQNYHGTVYEDGVAAMAIVLLESPVRVDIISIAPATNFPSLLDRFPHVVKKARVRSMSGSYFRGYHGEPSPVAEYNVAVCSSCMSRMYSAGWPVIVAPVDVGYRLLMSNQGLEILLSSLRIMAATLMQTWIFFCSGVVFARCSLQPSIEMKDGVFDVGPVFLTLPDVQNDLIMRELSVEVTSNGYTKIVNDNTFGHYGHSENVNNSMQHSNGEQDQYTDGKGSTLVVALNWKNVSLAEKYTLAMAYNISRSLGLN